MLLLIPSRRGGWGETEKHDPRGDGTARIVLAAGRLDSKRLSDLRRCSPDLQVWRATASACEFVVGLLRTPSVSCRRHQLAVVACDSVWRRVDPRICAHAHMRELSYRALVRPGEQAA